jgi:hypothetical protein
MTCDFLNGQFDPKAFDLSFMIGTLTCRPLLFEPVDARADQLTVSASADGFAGADQITLLTSTLNAHPLTSNTRLITLSCNPVADIADRYEA